MKTNCRDFFKVSGVVGAGIAAGGLTSCSQPQAEQSAMQYIKDAAVNSNPQQFNMCGYAAPKLDKVRVGNATKRCTIS